MKRLIKILFFSVFVFVLSMSFGMVSTDALESYVIGEDVDFANSLGQGYINTVLQEDGKIKTTLKTDNPSSVRMYYAASGSEQYRVNLNDFTFNYTIDTMQTNASYKIAFLKNWDDFPLDMWGTGLGFLMRDDNGGAYYVDPYLYTGGVGEQKLNDKSYYLVYQNSPRVSHLGKSITFRSVDNGDGNLLITMKFDEVTGSPVTYGNFFPKSYFTDRGMDVSSVLFMFGVNHNNSVDFEFTINEISDSNETAYNNAYGNAARTLFAEVAAIDQTNPDDSIAAIHRYYHLPQEVAATSNLRKSDRYLKTQAINKLNSLETAYANIVVTKKVELFGVYNDAFVVTAENLESVKSSLLVYNATKTTLADAELDGRMEQLALKVFALNHDNIPVKVTVKLDDEVQGTPTTTTQAVGDTYSPILSALEGEFMFWTVNGVVRTDLPQDLTIKVKSKLELVAHFASTGKYSVAYMDANTKLLDIDFVTTADALTVPSNPSRQGASFDGWVPINNYEAAPAPLENPGVKSYFVAKYTVTEPATYTVTVSGGTADKENYKLNEVATVTATNPTEFSYWKDVTSGAILSTNSTYSFTILDRNESIEAIYDTSFVSGPMVSIRKFINYETGYDAFIGHYELDETLYELIEIGFVHEDYLETPHVTKNVNSETKEFMVVAPQTISDNNNKMRVYMIYKIKATNEIVIVRDK